jgi:hypothetical protein
VRLVRATIGGDLDCDNGTLFNAHGRHALNANGIKVTGNAFLRHAFVAGGLMLIGATVGGDLDCTDTKPLEGYSLLLDLQGASAAGLADNENCWPTYGRLFLDGFTYQRFAGTTVPRDAISRLKWLRLQNRNRGLATQPYQQLAKVLESEGDEQGARKIRVAMEDDLLTSFPLYTRPWRWILKCTVAYGYQPGRALYWAFGFVLLGYLSFALGYRGGVIAPTDKDAFADFQANNLSSGYPPFNVFVYSLDSFLPIINLGLKDKWTPNPKLSDPRLNRPQNGTWLGDGVATLVPSVTRWWPFDSGRTLRGYLWIHIIAGWVLITLFAAGFTGIIRR